MMNVLSVCFYLSANLYIYARFMRSSSSSFRSRRTKQDNRVVWGVCGCLSIFKILCFIHVMRRHRCMYVYDFRTYVFLDLCLLICIMTLLGEQHEKKLRKADFLPPNLKTKAETESESEREAALLPHQWECLRDADSSFP